MIIDQRLFFEDKLFRYTCLKKKGNKLEYDLYITFFRVRRIDKSLLEITRLKSYLKIILNIFVLL